MKTLNKLEAVSVLNHILEKTRNCKGIDKIEAYTRVGVLAGYADKAFTRKYWYDCRRDYHFITESKALTCEEVLSILNNMVDVTAKTPNTSRGDLMFVISIGVFSESYIKDNKLVEPLEFLSKDATCYNLFHTDHNAPDYSTCRKVPGGFEYVLRLDATELIMQPSAEQVAASQVSQHLAQLSKLIYRDDTYLNTKQTTTNTPTKMEPKDNSKILKACEQFLHPVEGNQEYTNKEADLSIEEWRGQRYLVADKFPVAFVLERAGEEPILICESTPKFRAISEALLAVNAEAMTVIKLPVHVLHDARHKPAWGTKEKEPAGLCAARHLACYTMCWIMDAISRVKAYHKRGDKLCPELYLSLLQLHNSRIHTVSKPTLVYMWDRLNEYDESRPDKTLRDEDIFTDSYYLLGIEALQRSSYQMDDISKVADKFFAYVESREVPVWIVLLQTQPVYTTQMLFNDFVGLITQNPSFQYARYRYIKRHNLPLHLCGKLIKCGRAIVADSYAVPAVLKGSKGELEKHICIAGTKGEGIEYTDKQLADSPIMSGDLSSGTHLKVDKAMVPVGNILWVRELLTDNSLEDYCKLVAHWSQTMWEAREEMLNECS